MQIHHQAFSFCFSMGGRGCGIVRRPSLCRFTQTPRPFRTVGLVCHGRCCLGGGYRSARRLERWTAVRGQNPEDVTHDKETDWAVSAMYPSKPRRGDSPIRPNRPRILPKISITRILTKSWGSAASASAAVEPVMPTEMPQRRLQIPTARPPQKRAKPGVS